MTRAKKDKIRKQAIAIIMIHGDLLEDEAKEILRAFRIAGLQIIEKGQ